MNFTECHTRFFLINVRRGWCLVASALIFHDYWEDCLFLLRVKQNSTQKNEKCVFGFFLFLLLMHACLRELQTQFLRNITPFLGSGGKWLLVICYLYINDSDSRSCTHYSTRCLCSYCFHFDSTSIKLWFYKPHKCQKNKVLSYTPWNYAARTYKTCPT